MALASRHDLTDAQWTVLAPLLPAGKRPGRPSQWDERHLIDRIRWRVRVGAPWRDVAACHSSWRAVFALVPRWLWVDASPLVSNMAVGSKQLHPP